MSRCGDQPRQREWKIEVNGNGATAVEAVGPQPIDVREHVVKAALIGGDERLAAGLTCEILHDSRNRAITNVHVVDDDIGCPKFIRECQR